MVILTLLCNWIFFFISETFSAPQTETLGPLDNNSPCCHPPSHWWPLLHFLSVSICLFQIFHIRNHKICLRTLNIEIQCDQAITLWEIYPKYWKLRLKQIPACQRSLLHSSQLSKRGNNSSLDGYVNRMWYIHALEHKSAIRRNEVLTHTST